MKGDALHNFDLALCRYALENIRPHLTEPDFVEYARTQIGQPLWDRVAASSDSPFLLTEQDLLDLADAFASGPFQLDKRWLPYLPLHGRSINCVGEIRESLAGEYADEWAAQSAGFARRLEADTTCLGRGIGIVLDWVKLVRRYLRAMGATAFLPHPEGSFPTPACPDPPAPPVPPESNADQAAQVGGDAILGAIADIRDLLLTQKTVKESYSTAEVAAILGKAEYTTREWCRQGRIRATKKPCGRGKAGEWLVSHTELTRLKNEGLLPIDVPK